MRVELFPQKGVRFPGRRQQWFIRLVASNGETLAVSEAYVSKWNAKRAAAKNFPGLPVKETSG
jgi:uncharacterized protein YegP (UPF0339 family)